MTPETHDNIQTHGEPCPICGGCDWVCAEAHAASEQARQRAEKMQAACEKALFDAIEEGGCPMYEVQMEPDKGKAWPVAAYERIENLAPDAPLDADSRQDQRDETKA